MLVRGMDFRDELSNRKAGCLIFHITEAEEGEEAFGYRG